MRILVFGTGTIGQAVSAVARDAGHEVLTVGRTSGDEQADLTSKVTLDALFERVGAFDAVACAAGDVYPAPLALASDGEWTRSLAAKGRGQIDLVRAGLPHISAGGSFTLVSGILGDEVTPAMTIGATVNALVEGFVRSAATELGNGARINCVSPSVLVESPAYHSHFSGFAPVPSRDVGLAYLRAMSNPYNGRVLRVHRLA